MKRDMDLVRLILIQVEGADGPIDVGKLGTGNSSLEELFYHVELMQAHGLLDAELQYGFDGARNVPFKGKVKGLTWDGCDYLDAIRNDNIWNRTKETIKNAVGSTTMATIRSTAVLITEQAIRASLGL